MKQEDKELKARVFALYYLEQVLMHEGWDSPGCVFNIKSESETCWLELKPLSAISDEDVLEVARLRGFVNFTRVNCNDVGYFVHWNLKSGKERGKFIKFIDLLQPEIDYLRSRGYALPAFGYTVEELTNKGIIKVK